MNVLLILYLLAIAPKLLFERIWKKKKHPGFLQRLGFSIPDNRNQPTIWIHAVSVGEVKAAQPLLRELKKKHPHHFFLITTTTATGHAEAKRILKGASAYAYLPLDFSWVVRRFVAKLKPELFLFVEGDFWPNLLSALKKNRTKIALVSGKVSARSARRFQFFSPLSKKLFSHFDILCVQSEEHKKRFAPLVDPARLHITGNLKLDIEAEAVDVLPFRDRVPLQTLTLSCTHAPEEKLLLEVLKEIDGLIFLAPRHPERFEEVAHLLEEKAISFIRWKEFLSCKEKVEKRIVLVDTMGELPTCYSLSRLAIVGGSYVSHIGGHNVLEPCLYGTPVFFGPHTYTQEELTKLALQSGAGRRVELEELSAVLKSFFQDGNLEAKMRAAASKLVLDNRGATERTLNLLRSF